MRSLLIKKIAIIVGISGMILSAQTVAETAPTPLKLQQIMFDMGSEMQNITAAISSENWSQVEKSAAWIADHPKPPVSERTRIMSLLGSEMSTFKNSDMKTHSAARELAKIAKGQDGRAIISAFSTLQQSCLSCHEQYRERFKEHFYAQ